MMVDREPAALGTEQEASGTTATTVVRTRVVEDLSTGDFRACRKMITGPDVNQHPPYPGCTGFVGWESVMRRSSGELLCSFSAGYWHVSNPTPIDFEPETLKSWKAVGFRTDIDAPTGGRALVCRSNDDGKTWSQPVTLVDTPGDDRHPVIVELPDDSLLCVFFVIDNWYGYDAPPKGRHKNSRVASIRSTDDGKTWSEPVYMPSPFKYYDRMCGKPSVLPSGRVILPTYGKDSWTDSPEQLGVYASDDFGKSWKFLSRLKSADGALDEPAITRAHDGTLVMIARPAGQIAFSSDKGQSWSTPQAFGVKMVAPCLLTLKDGTVVCIFGWGATGGVQMMWSDDSGRTWTTPAADRGFKIDDSVYVYAIGCEMPDGSIYVVYYDPGEDQTKTAIQSVRVRIREDRQGIEILPPDKADLASRIGPDKKMIKTGQDMPNAAYLKNHIREIEKLGFDGVTIDLDAQIGNERQRLTYRWWSPQIIDEQQVRDSIEDLQAVHSEQLTDNFLWVCTQSQAIASPDWLDDEGFAKIRSNMVLAAKIAKSCGLKGLFIDVEQYGGMKWSPWAMRFNYPQAHASQKDMHRRGLVDRVVLWDEYAKAARQRGYEIMHAMCEVYPDITIIFLPGIQEYAKDRIGHGQHACPDETLTGLASSDCGMLAPFGDGLLEGAAPKATIVDGFESSYAFTLNKRFVEGRQRIANAYEVSSVPKLYDQRMKVGFGLMLDMRYPARGGWRLNPENFVNNHFTPAEFSDALYFAMLNADRYVWVWNELNGAVFLDAPPRDPEIRANIPPAYLQAIKQAREPRSMSTGRDSQAARNMPIPPKAKERSPDNDKKTFAEIQDKYEIIADLPKEWLFYADEEALGIGYYTAADWDVSDWTSIEIGDYMQRQGHRFRGVGWYRCSFKVPQELAGKKVFLIFGGVSANHFYVNSQWCSRTYSSGYRIVDINSIIRFGEDNIVVVPIFTTGQPGGIYKSVKLAVQK